MKKIFLSIAIFLSSISYSQNSIDNQFVIDLFELGFEKEIIISKINSSSIKNFNTSVSELQKLKKLGIHTDILVCMINVSKEEIRTGIFYVNNNIEKEISLNQWDGGRTKGGVGLIMSGGLTNISKIKYLNDLYSSNIVSKSESTIYFQFGKENDDAFRKNKEWFSGASTPNEFKLFKATSRKKRREVVLDKKGIGAAVGGGGVKNDSFSFERLGNNRYKIILNPDLELGEYVFLIDGTDDVWDFSLVK